jgi:hypothetical protein
MRLAEKTLELTLCHQIGATLFPWPPWPPRGGPQRIWFGLTQKQEAEAGFDAATRLHGGRLLLRFGTYAPLPRMSSMRNRAR